ncbi:MAG: hypothetical protein WC956_00890 [bacterium]
MIKFFFNRFSRAVTAMEIAGALLLSLAALRSILMGTSVAQGILLSVVAALYAFIRLCTSVRWYRDAPRYSGIELQFRKAIVPTSYVMAIFLAWFAASPSAAPLAIAAFMLAVVAHVNVILLYLRSRDNDRTPVNFYSSGAFLNSLNDAPILRQAL